MPNTIITYESIYETLRKEKYEQEIQKLSETFYSDVIEYLKEKQSIAETQKSKKSIFSDEIAKTEKQIQNTKKLLKELYERRENKILQLALFSSRTQIKIDLSNLLPEEIELFESIVSSITLYKDGILHNILSLKLPKITNPKDIKTEDQEKNKLVRFLTAVPKFMGEDLNIYGPFDSDDIASLPTKSASLLIKNKRAQEIKIENSKKNQEIL